MRFYCLIALHAAAANPLPRNSPNENLYYRCSQSNFDFYQFSSPRYVGVFDRYLLCGSYFVFGAAGKRAVSLFLPRRIAG